MSEDADNGDPIPKDKHFGPDLSGVNPARRRLVGFGMIAAFIAVVLFAVFSV